MRVAAGFVHKFTRSVKREIRAMKNGAVERQANALAVGFPHGRIAMKEDAGYATFSAADIGLAAPVSRLSQLAQAWKADPARSESDKPFLRNILQSQDLFEHKEILETALHEDLLGAVVRYLGQMPWLVNLQVWWTPPNQTTIRSQLYHYDHRDTRQAKVFLNLNDVGEDAGPLHFLPVPVSAKVDRTVGYSQDRYTDEQIESCVTPAETMRTMGPAGAGFIVDTARCLHYGSRRNEKDRLLLMASFARANCVSKGAGCEVLDPVRGRLVADRFADDPARAFVVSAG